MNHSAISTFAMNTITKTPNSRLRSRVAETIPVDFRHPHYECREEESAVRLSVYVPGVDPSGIEITARGPDLMITARKEHFVRVNFSALHLESAQKDYLLKLRLGKGLDYESLHAEISGGILTVEIPKRSAPPVRSRLRLVA
jgi:HSP20 family molecular chaperone IbpA